MNKALIVMMNTRMCLTKKASVEENASTATESANIKVDKEKKILPKYDPPIRFKGREFINLFMCLSALCVSRALK